MSQITIDLTQGIAETTQYKAWKFPGGEIHVKLSDEVIETLEEDNEESLVFIHTRLNNSDNILLLGFVTDIIKNTYEVNLQVVIPYFPYQQADREFSEAECFSLLTITKIIKNFAIDGIYVYDPHSDVTPALLKEDNRACFVIDNSEHIKSVLAHLTMLYNSSFLEGTTENPWTPTDNLVIISPDAGAYKKIFKLCEKIGFKGQIETANKFRDAKTGEVSVRLSTNDFEGKDILVIDDICMGGRTFVQLAQQLVKCNVGNLNLAVSHCIYNNGLGHLEALYQNLFTTTSIHEEYDTDFVIPEDVFELMSL